MLKQSILSLSILSVLTSAAALAAAPGKPTIGWGDYTYALVEIDQSQVAYEKLIKAVHDEIDIEVTWDVWSGDAAQTARVLLDNRVVWEGAASAKRAVFKMSKGGRYNMAIELENQDGTSRSDNKLLTIADTDGSHLEAMPTIWTENNQPYQNQSGKIVGTYFVEWGVYGRNYPIDKVPTANLNRILYGFVPICGGDGINDSLKTIDGSFQALQNACAGRDDFKVAIHDPWAAIQKPQLGVEGWSVPYKGNFGQMMAAKKANPELKILPSIGGWTLSDPFFLMHDDAKRHTFVESVREYLETWKFFDGVDIDFEFPGGSGANPNLGDKERDGELYVTILKELRAMLDELGTKHGRYYELTSAINVGYDKIAVVDYAKAAQYLDNIYMMSYDFYGAWDNSVLNHQTGLHQSSVNNVESASRYYASRGAELLLEQGVPAEKLVIGAAAYGRGWTGVHNYTNGNPFTGTATGPIKGTWENGVVDYRDIVNNHGSSQGFEYGYDQAAEAPYLFKPSTGDLITYDDPRSVKAKAQYVMQQGMGGIFHWEMDADNGDLLNAMHEGLGHGDGTTEPENRAPIARAGADKIVIGPVSVSLDGSQSSDPEGEALTYHWTQTAGSPITLVNHDKAQASIDVPATETQVSYTFTLTVSDPQGASASDSVVITNQAPATNQAPTVSLAPITYVNENTRFTLTATANDADGDALNYTWHIPSQFVIIEGGHDHTLTLLAPEVDSDSLFNIEVSVNDSEASANATTQVQVKNIEEPGVGGDQCQATDPNASNYPIWNASTVYTNETVRHHGLIYTAKWWVQGSEPSPSNEAWQLMSKVELPWSAGIAYNGTEQTNHNGSRWQAKWWTKGDEPGSAAVWVNVGQASCN
ncbi:MAG: glycosyl hydrolase family 18 protein [Vibrio sp.]